jgi:DUF1009 family protein
VSAPPNAAPIGLLAGWGRLPVVVAESLRRAGHEVCAVGIRDLADPELRTHCLHYTEAGIAKVGGWIRFFRRHKVRRAVMAGKFRKELMFQRLAWIRHLPDWRCLRALCVHYFTDRKDLRDDSVVQAVIDEFARDGIVFEPPTDFAPELLVQYGHLAGPRLSRGQEQDIEFGWQVAKDMGRHDVGQSVAVKRRTVLAVEAVEGTDECIRRAGRLCTSGGFVVVKVAKPHQDMRFDVPTIGVGTLKTLVESGGTALALEAGKSIVLDEPEVAEFARRNRLTVVAVKPGRVAELADAA